MSKRFSPAAVGAFVVGAILLTVIAVVAFGSGRFFRKTYTYVLYFTGDVSGLNVGAPVKLKGVEIGIVSDVKINLGQEAMIERPGAFRIPVLIEIDAARLAEKGAKQMPTKEVIKKLVDLGLRAQLTTQSFVTGLLYIKLAFYPGTPVDLVNDPKSSYPELPTIPTPLEEMQARATRLLAKLNEADLPGMVESLRGAIDGLDSILNSPHLKSTVERLPAAVDGLKAVSSDASAALVSLRKLSDNLDARLGPLSGEMNTTAAQARETLSTATRTLEQIQTKLRPDSTLSYSLNRSLTDLSVAARAIRRAAEELERDPSVLLRGKSSEEEQ